MAKLSKYSMPFRHLEPGLLITDGFIGFTGPASMAANIEELNKQFKKSERVIERKCAFDRYGVKGSK